MNENEWLANRFEEKGSLFQAVACQLLDLSGRSPGRGGEPGEPRLMKSDSACPPKEKRREQRKN